MTTAQFCCSRRNQAGVAALDVLGEHEPQRVFAMVLADQSRGERGHRGDVAWVGGADSVGHETR